MNRVLQNLEIMSMSFNYNEWLFTSISDYVGDKVLEIGCGIGNMMIHLANKELAVGIDICETSLRKAKKRFEKSNNIKIVKCDVLDENMPNILNQKFDTILCINVLEHIKDDYRALINKSAVKSCAKRNNNSGRFVNRWHAGIIKDAGKR